MITNFLSSVLRIFSSARNVTDTRNGIKMIRYRCFCSVSSGAPDDEGTDRFNCPPMTSTASLIHHHYQDIGSTKLIKQFVKDFPKVTSVSRYQLRDLLVFLRRHGYTWLEVQEFKDVLLLSPVQFHDRVTFLQDFSIPHPMLHLVLHLNRIMEMSIVTLRECGIYTPDTDVFAHLLAESTKDLQLPSDIVEGFCRLYQNNDAVSLKELYMYLLKHYLSLRFGEDKAEVEACLRENDHLCTPLRTFVRRCDFLLETLGLGFSEVRENSFLLEMDTAHAERIIEIFPSIGGTPTIEIARAFPKLLTLWNIELWIQLLKKYKVTDFTFTQHTLHMFILCRRWTVEQRLKALRKMPEWEVVKVSNELFYLLRHPQSFQRLLAASEADQDISRISQAIAGDEVKKRPYVKEASPELLTYLAHHLSITVLDARDLLSEGFHSLYGIRNTKKVLKLLFEFGFTREQILIGMMVLGLECSIVEQALKQFPYHHSAQPFSEWMASPFVLHLLVYCIKKDFLHPEVSYKKKKIKELEDI